MNKVLVTGDWQLESAPPCDRRDARGRSIRFDENVQTILNMVAEAKAEGCKRMVFLGDLTEERNPDSKTLDGAATIFRAAMDAGMKVDAIAGNHDGAIYDISSSSLEALGKAAGHDNFKVWHKPGVVSFKDYHFVFLPYLHEASPEQVKKALEDVLEPLEGPAYLFGHYGVVGSTVGPKNMVLPGDKLDAATCLAKHFRRIYMGHIHKAQELLLGDTTVRFPGSPYICDFGERDDLKGYSILDPELNKDKWVQIQPKRKWMVINYYELNARLEDYATGGGGPINEFDFGWDEQDIVKLVGEYNVGENPQELIRNNFKNKLWTPEPFYKIVEMMRRRENRDVRAGAEAVSGAGGFAEAVAMFVAKKWPGHELAMPVIEAILAELRESKPASMDRSVVPTRIELRDFMSHKVLDHDFFRDQPELIVGPNGIGKTNIMEALLFALTGETSKPLKYPGLVRQRAKKASVTLYLLGEKYVYRIVRTLSLTARGATHKVKVESKPVETVDTADWSSLADGGVDDTQDMLSAVIGATYKSLKATNFMFQKDRSPVVTTDPGDRKGILGEIFGFEPIAKAFGKLEKKRLAAVSANKELKAKQEGLTLAWDPAKEKEVKESLTKVQTEVPGLKKAADSAMKVSEEAKAMSTRATEALAKVNNDLTAMPDSSGTLKGAEDALVQLEKSYAEEWERRAATYRSDRTQIATLKTEIVKVDVKALTARAEVLTASKISFQKTLDELAPLIEKASASRTTASTNLDVLDKEHLKILDDIKALKNNDIGTCSKCGQVINSGHIEKEIADLNEKITANRRALNPHLEVIQAADKDQAVLNDKKRVADRDLKATGAEMEQVVAEVAAVQQKIKELERLETRFADTEKQGLEAKDTFETKKKDSQSKIEELLAKVRIERTARASKEAEKEMIQKDMWTVMAAAGKASDALSAALLTVANKEKDLEALAETVKGFDEIKLKMEATAKEVLESAKVLELNTMAAQALDPKAGGLPVWLIDARLPELEDNINRYMEIFGTEGLSVSLTTVTEDGKETLDVLVDNGEEPTLDVAAYSGGQLDRIEMCLKHALADLAESMRDVRLGLLAYDEPGVHLDEQRKSKLIEMIHERCTSGRTPVAVVISHDRKLMSGFRRRLSIRQNDERTILEAV